MDLHCLLQAPTFLRLLQLLRHPSSQEVLPVDLVPLLPLVLLSLGLPQYQLHLWLPHPPMSLELRHLSQLLPTITITSSPQDIIMLLLCITTPPSSTIHHLQSWSLLLSHQLM